MTKQEEIKKYEDCDECPYGKDDYDGQTYFPLHLATPCLDCMNEKVLNWEKANAK